jgi:hypothetical protein
MTSRLSVSIAERLDQRQLLLPTGKVIDVDHGSMPQAQPRALRRDVSAPKAVRVPPASPITCRRRAFG